MRWFISWEVVEGALLKLIYRNYNNITFMKLDN